jgi:DNA transformation protein and related proteins
VSARTAVRARRFRSLKVSAPFKAFVLDQLEELGDVEPRSMFGGVGLYSGGVFFGLIARDVLYLKVDDTTRPAYVKAGMPAFQPYPGRMKGTSKYYAVPVEVLESASELAVWARKSVAVGGRTKVPSVRKRAGR